MAFQLIDRYLLGEPVSKAALVDALLADRSSLPEAAPFYRGIEAVGVRAADIAFVALRIVLAGGEPTDERVQRVRALSNVARLARNGEAAQLRDLFAKEAAALAALPRPPETSLDDVAAAAREAYRAEVAAEAG